MININKDLDKMIKSGRLAAKVLDMIKNHIKPGISTGQLERICKNYILNTLNTKSAIQDYLGFPKSVCISLNEIVCHGIPDENKYIKNGDILNIDVTIIENGFYGDTSKMFFAGIPSIISRRLCEVAKKSLYLAIEKLKPGLKVNVIGKTIQKFVESNGFSVVRDYCGHGIGNKFHDFPRILHYDNNDNYILEPGMGITIEPMINTGSYEVKLMKDKWTVKTKDHGLSAQYEHTIVITNKGYVITTLRNNEKINI